MARPPSVTKINKDGVTFVSSVDRAQYTIAELTGGALRDVAKLLRRRVKDAAPVDTGNLRRNIGTWVRKGEEGKYYLQVGVYDKARAETKGLKDAYYAQWQEFGSSKRPASNNGQGFLGVTVKNSIDDIRRIEAQYLSAIEYDEKAEELFADGEEIADD